MSIDGWFDQLPPEQQDIARSLRALILQASSQITEQIKWRVPTYSVRRNICSIMAYNKHINLQFFQGAHLKDVQSLQGTGTDMRHLRFTSVEHIHTPLINRLLKQAIEVDALP